MTFFNTMSLITLVTATFIVSAPLAINVNAPATVTSGATYTASGSSHTGESGTTITLTHNGVDVTSSATIVWDGNSFTVTLPEAPPHDPSEVNLIEIEVVSGADSVIGLTSILKK